MTKPQKSPTSGPGGRRRPLGKVLGALRREWALPASVLTAALFLLFGAGWLADLSHPLWFAFLAGWLFAAILCSAFAVVRHAEELAVIAGEPLGTLVLTLAVTGIESAVIAAVMYGGHGSSCVARDAMFAVVMIVLNGMVGLSLLLGGLRYREQTYNLQGANAYLAVIVPLAVLALVLPNFTTSSPGPTLSPFHAAFLVIVSVGVYAVFLSIQTVRHRDYFVPPGREDAAGGPGHGKHESHSAAYHALLLVAYLVPLVYLAEKLAFPVDYVIEVRHGPAALGGLVVAVLVLSPESLSAVRAALANQLQRSVNLLLGSVLASISLTVPAVLLIGLVTGRSVTLGLEAVDITLLLLTLAVSMLTFSSARTNVLLGAVHLLLFVAYLMLLFER
jgi:Ca2+:H+ antiporter